MMMMYYLLKLPVRRHNRNAQAWQTNKRDALTTPAKTRRARLLGTPDV